MVRPIFILLLVGHGKIFLTAVLASEYLDLSQDFQEAPVIYNNNEGATVLLEAATNSKALLNFENLVMGYLVVENGLKVAEYYNPSYNMTNTTINAIYSVNKSFTGLCFGIMEYLGLIALNETLLDIWPLTSHGDMWNQVSEANLRQAITIESLLVHTSGFDDPALDSIDFQNLGGSNLTDALNFPQYLGDDQVGKFAYLAFANILSYVVYERTGRPIQEFMQENYFDLIGISPDEYSWATNQEGMGYSRNGLSLSIPQMAKWGQTYLQNGFVNNMSIIVAADWVERATTSKVEMPESDLLYQALDSQGKLYYGYMLPLWMDDGQLSHYCAYGASGQWICVWPKLSRVAACQTNISSSTIGSLFVETVHSLTFERSVSTNGSDESSQNSSGTKTFVFTPFDRLLLLFTSSIILLTLA